MRSTALLVMTAALLFVPHSACAQGSRYAGYWGSLGVGAGWRVVSEAGETEATTGGAFYVRMGGVLGDRILLGGEVSAWGRDENEVFVTRTNGLLSVLLFPSPQLGFFVKGGAGGVLVRAADVSTVPSERAITRYGVGAALGIGYDIPFGRSASVTPNIDFSYQWVDDPDVRSGAVILLTLGVTWH